MFWDDIVRDTVLFYHGHILCCYNKAKLAVLESNRGTTYIFKSKEPSAQCCWWATPRQSSGQDTAHRSKLHALGTGLYVKSRAAIFYSIMSIMSYVSL